MPSNAKTSYGRWDALRFVREGLDGTIPEFPVYSQAEAYYLCAKVEKSLPDDLSRRRFENVSDVDEGKYAARKFRTLEQAKRGPIAYDYEIAARAFGLPEKFFAEEFAGERDVTAACIKWLKLRSEWASIKPRNFPEVYGSDFVPPSRIQAFERLTAMASRQEGGPGKVILVEGASTVGKSYLLSAWAHRHLAAGGIESLRIDCSALSIDQIMPEIDTIITGFNSPSVVVLDGLRIDMFREGPPLVGRSHARRPSINDLLSCAADIISGWTVKVVVVAMENNAGSSADRDFSTRLRNGLSFHHLRVEPLSRAESMEFLKLTSRRDRLPPEWIYEELSDLLQGMPMALMAANEEIRHLNDVDLERYVSSLSSADADRHATGSLSHFHAFISSFLQRLQENTQGETDSTLNSAHPHAFLRLLALMPSPKPRGHLEELISSGKIKRLTGHLDIASFARSVPFVREIDGAFDLHALVRAVLLNELQASLTGGADSNVSNDELEWIHWKCSVQNWRMIKKLKDSDRLTISVIEAFVYHAMKQIELMPDERRNKHHASFSAKSFDAFEKAKGTLTDLALWLATYELVVKPHLMKRGHPATRMHGQYEAKARILEALVERAEHLPIAPLNKAELHKEIALTWMHTGRLQLAHAQATHCIRIWNQIEADLVGFAQSISVMSDNKAREQWRHIIEALSIRSTIKLRLGRMVEEILDDIAPFVEAAQNIVRDGHLVRLANISDYRPALESGVVKILSRHAELKMISGDKTAAMATFAQADAMQMASKGNRLDGEAARRYAALMARDHVHDPARLQEAFKILEDNLEFMAKVEKQRGRMSNDIVPFLVLKAGLIRLSGDLDDAEKMLSAVEDHPYVLSRECTYSARLELKLERLRLRLAQGVKSKGVLEDAQRLTQECYRSHHLLAANECAIVALEAMPTPKREPELHRVRTLLISHGHFLRLEDVDELRAKGSAILRFGV